MGAKETEAAAIEDNHPALDDRAKNIAHLPSFIPEEGHELIFLKYYKSKKNIGIGQMLDMNPIIAASLL